MHAFDLADLGGGVESVVDVDDVLFCCRVVYSNQASISKLSTILGSPLSFDLSFKHSFKLHNSMPRI